MPMFTGFQRTNQPFITARPVELFAGIPKTDFGNNGTLPYAQMGNMTAWWETSNSITLNSGNVSSMLDKLNSYNMQQATAANQPLWVQQDSTVRGLSEITFTSGKSLSAGNILTIGTGNLSACVVFMLNATTPSNNDIIFCQSQNNGASNSGEWCIRVTAGTSNILTQFFDEVSAKSTTVTTLTLGVVYIVHIVIDRTNGRLYNYVNNGVQSATIATTGSNLNPAAALKLNSAG